MKAPRYAVFIVLLLFSLSQVKIFSSVLCSYLYSIYVYKGKGKVIPVLFLTEHHAMKAYCRVEVELFSFLDLGTRWR
jgi:hypothetical protein